MAIASFIYGELISRDIYDQVSEFASQYLTRMRGYISVKCGDSYRTIPMDSAGATYYFLDRFWVFDGYITLTETGCELYNFFFIGTDDERRPVVGVTIILDEPITIETGRHEFRLEYKFTVDQWFVADVACLGRSNLSFGEYLCAI